MLEKKLSLIFFSLLVVFATGCSQVTIESPDSETVYLEAPEFQVTTDNGPPDSVTAKLNGEDISGYFSVSGDYAVANDPYLNSLLKHGTNLLSVTAPGVASREFTVDLEGPAIHILSVDSSGGTIQVRGYLNDPSPIASLTYSDSSSASGTIPLSTCNAEDGAKGDVCFNASLSKVDPNTMIFHATDSVGQTSDSSFYRSTAGLIENTMGLRLNLGALDFASQVAPDILAQMDIISIMQEQNPLWSIGDSSFPGCLLPNGRIELSDGVISIPELNLSPATTEGYELQLDTLITDMDLDLSMKTNLACIEFSQDITAEAVALAASALVNIEVVNGEIQVSDIQILDLDFDGLDAGLKLFNIDGLEIQLGDILFGIQNSLANAFDFVIAFIAETPLEQSIAKILADIPVAIDADIDLGDGITHNVNVAGFFNDVYRDNTSLMINLGASATTSTPMVDVETLGVRVFGNGIEPAVSAPSGTEYDFNMALSTSFLNQMLDVAFNAGLTHINIDLNQAVGISNIRASVAPASPPFAETINSHVGMARINLHDFQVIMEYLPPDATEYELLFSAKVNMSAPFSINVNEDKSLAVSVSTLSTIEVLSIDTVGPLAEGTPELVESLIGAAAPIVIPMVANVFETIELPSILGLTMQPGEIWSDDTTGSIMVAGDLIQVAE